MNTDESLSKIFNTEPQPSPVNEIEVLPPLPLEETDTSSKVDSDYDKSRANIHDLLDIGKEALNASLALAKSTEHPRAFEVVGNLMKQLTDMNQQLMDIHHQKKKLDDPGKSAQKSVTNNAIFVGSTADLNKMIKKISGE